MYNLKRFDVHSEYSSYISGDPTLPNVSYCYEQNEVHYNDILFVRINDISTIIGNSTPDPNKEGNGMINTYNSVTFSGGYGITKTTNNPTFIFDGYEQFTDGYGNYLNDDVSIYERYITTEINCGNASNTNGYIYRNITTGEWVFFCNGDRGGSIYWVNAFCKFTGQVDWAFLTLYSANTSQIETNITPSVFIQPKIVSFNGVVPGNIFNDDVKTFTIILDGELTLPYSRIWARFPYYGDIGDEESAIAEISSLDGITWTGEFDNEIPINGMRLLVEFEDSYGNTLVIDKCEYMFDETASS